MNTLGKAGVIGRWKPLHNGAAVMLETLCEMADSVIIGIGSSNKYNCRNPFTAKESKGMIDALLSPKYSNYKVIAVPDFAHIPKYRDGQQWRKYVINKYDKNGKLDCFVSGNDYVCQLLKKDYPIIHPASLIPPEKQVMLRATEVRVEMAKGNELWKKMVPKQVADYIVRNGLDSKLRKEFGLEILYSMIDKDYRQHEDADAERKHTLEA